MDGTFGEELKRRYQQPNQAGMQMAGFAAANLLARILLIGSFREPVLYF